MKKLLPVVLAVIGVALGVGAGFMLRPDPVPVATDELHEGAHDAAATPNEMPPIAAKSTGDLDYMSLHDQFVVPVVKDGKMISLVLISLSLETLPNAQAKIIENEPRLRGALLQVMFDYANIGGFDGAFTNSSRLDKLRRNFFEVAQSIFGDDITDVLITEITRQDM
ncbi:MAG: flagellar basal body-associated protein FliL [Shimia sp.]|jgi:hypothetical protein|uniref:flagellar basal body-associated protein FliL n=1 Tax=Shimia sp. TaxID=1954381 RepID=UPI00405975D9